MYEIGDGKTVYRVYGDGDHFERVTGRWFVYEMANAQQFWDQPYRYEKKFIKSFVWNLQECPNAFL